MEKGFKESHEKDVERLTVDSRCETESKELNTFSQKRSRTYCPVYERSYLTSVDSGHVSDGEWGFLPS